MSKMLDDMRKEAAVMAVIEYLRWKKLSDNTILAEIMKKFNLTEEEAQNYMLQESA